MVGWENKIKKICLGGVGKIKNLLGGSLSFALTGKGEGVYAARRPFVNVTNVTQRNETIYYILHYDRSHSIVYNIFCLKRHETPQKPTCTALFIRCRKEYLHF